MQPGSPSIVIKWDHTEKRKPFITSHALQTDRQSSRNRRFFFFNSSWHYSCWQAIVSLYLKISSLLLLFNFKQKAYMAVCLFFYHQNQPRNRIIFVSYMLFVLTPIAIILYNPSGGTLEIFKSTGSSLKPLVNYKSNLGNSW